MPAPDPPRSPSLGTRPCACGPRSRCGMVTRQRHPARPTDTGRYRPVATAGAKTTTAQAVPRELRACCGSPMHPSPGPNRCLSVAPDASRGWDAEYQRSSPGVSHQGPTDSGDTANPRSTLPQRSSRPLNDASDAIPRTFQFVEGVAIPLTREEVGRMKWWRSHGGARRLRAGVEGDRCGMVLGLHLVQQCGSFGDGDQDAAVGAGVDRIVGLLVCLHRFGRHIANAASSMVSS